MDFLESEASLIAKQALSELLVQVATFCSLERSETEDQNKVLDEESSLPCPNQQLPTRAAIDLSLPWHSAAVEIADRNFNIVMGKLSKRMKSLNPARPWGPTVTIYHTCTLEAYVPKPQSLIVPSRPPPAERTAENQPFYLVPRHPDDPRV